MHKILVVCNSQDSPRLLLGEAVKLYVYLARHVDLRLKQKIRGNGEYLLGRTFAKKYETIVQNCYGDRKSARSLHRNNKPRASHFQSFISSGSQADKFKTGKTRDFSGEFPANQKKMTDQKQKKQQKTL